MARRKTPSTAPGRPILLFALDYHRCAAFAGDLVWSNQANLPVYLRRVPVCDDSPASLWAGNEEYQPFMPEPLKKESFEQFTAQFAFMSNGRKGSYPCTPMNKWEGPTAQTGKEQAPVPESFLREHGLPANPSDHGMLFVYAVSDDGATADKLEAGEVVKLPENVLVDSDGRPVRYLAASEGKVHTRLLDFGIWWREVADPVHKAVASRLVLHPRPLSEQPAPHLGRLGMNHDNGEFNVWHRLKEQMPVPDLTATMQHPAVKIFLQHLEYLAGGEAKVVSQLWNRYCHMLQHPHKKVAWSPAYVSEQDGGRRQGKTFVLYLMSAIWRAMGSVIPGDSVFEKFTYSLDFKVYVGLNEMPALGDAKNKARFKSLLTDRTYLSERKFEGVDAHAPNYINFDITSNDPKCWDVIAEPERALIVRCPSKRKNKAYYDQLETLLEPGNLSALMGAMLQFELPAEWDHREPAYQSEGAKVLAEQQRDPLEAFIEDRIERGIQPFDRDMGTITDLMVALRDPRSEPYTRDLRITDKSLPKALLRLGAIQREAEVKEGGVRVWRAKTYVWRDHKKWTYATPADVRAYLEPTAKPASNVSQFVPKNTGAKGGAT